MLTYLKSLLHPLPARALAQQELNDAERELLRAQSTQEYCTAMVQYNEDRIARLRAFIKETELVITQGAQK